MVKVLGALCVLAGGAWVRQSRVREDRRELETLFALASALERDGQRWPMSGIFPVETRFCPKPQGLGYVRADVVLPNPYFP